MTVYKSTYYLHLTDKEQPLKTDLVLIVLTVFVKTNRSSMTLCFVLLSVADDVP